MKRAIVVASIQSSGWPQESGRICPAADWLEVDACGGRCLPADEVRARFSGDIIFTLGSASNGRLLTTAERRARLKQAAAGYDIIDLDPAEDLTPEILEAIPPERRMISWSGRSKDSLTLIQLAERLFCVGARYYRFGVCAETFDETHIPLLALKRLNRRDVAAFALGDIGYWTRLVAPRFGAPLVFGTAADGIRVNGVASVQELVTDYGLPELPQVKRVYGIISTSLRHSASPRLHNLAYRATDQHALYLPFVSRSLREFLKSVVEEGTFERLGLRFGGLTVASPFKEEAAELVNPRSAIVRRARSSNLVIAGRRGLRAETSDPETVRSPLAKRRVSLAGRRVAVIGCGGSGRAIAAALDRAGAHVTLVNRSVERGHRAETLLRLPFVPLGAFDPGTYSMVVNATSVGSQGDALPVRIDRLHRGAIVIDLVYGGIPTPLVNAARDAGHTVIDGHEVLLAQVRSQFKLMVGRRTESAGDIACLEHCR